MSGERPAAPGSVGDVLWSIVARPRETLVERWNWKAALLSAIVRSAIFFAANLSAGLDAARAAWLTELVLRGAMSGFYGAVTQAFRRAEPRWAATLAALILLPLVAHSLELVVHWWRGTAELATSLAASVAFSGLSTAFNLYAMRRGALIVADCGSQSLVADLRRIPRLIAGFVRDTVVSAWRAACAGHAWMKPARARRGRSLDPA